MLRCWRRSSVFPQAKLGSHHREGQQAPTRRRGRFNSPPHQLSRKLLSILDRLGCFSFLSALASIWRMRSRVTENCWPTSSSVCHADAEAHAQNALLPSCRDLLSGGGSGWHLGACHQSHCTQPCRNSMLLGSTVQLPD